MPRANNDHGPSREAAAAGRLGANEGRRCERRRRRWGGLRGSTGPPPPAPRQVAHKHAGSSSQQKEQAPRASGDAASTPARGRPPFLFRPRSPAAVRLLVRRGGASAPPRPLQTRKDSPSWLNVFCRRSRRPHNLAISRRSRNCDDAGGEGSTTGSFPLLL
jgi:hypothetical protein